jgi:hypothetical protein
VTGRRPTPVSGQHPSRATNRLQARRRRQRQRLALAAGVVVAIAVVGVLTGHKQHATSAPAHTTTTPRRTAPVRLSPPGPLPGYLLIADRGNNRMLLVDSAKRIYWTYPKPGFNPAMAWRFDDDTFFGPRLDRIISNQEDQHTIQIISFPGGRVLWRYGHVNVRGSAPGYLNTPDDAYLLPSGIITVADAYNCRVLFISRAHKIVKQYGSGVCRHNPPAELGAINGATPLADGGTLVSEINGSWIDNFGPDGRLRWSVAAPVSYPSDPELLAPDRILLADYARPGHAIVMTRAGRVLWRYGPASGPGELDHPSLATRIAPGLIAITDDYRHRIVVISMRTKRIVWQYGHTDIPGASPGYLHTPDGLDLLRTADAQRLPVLRALLSKRAPRASHPVVTARGALRIVRAPYHLPSPVEREVAAPWRGSVILAGGLDTALQSTNGVFRLDATTGRLAALGTVPQPFHDAAGAILGTKLLIFGGGASRSSASVQAFDLRSRRGSVIAQLPRALSDLASATVGHTVYLVGGYDGARPRAEIYRTTDGLHFRLAGQLPAGVRYPGVAAVGTTLVIAGGATAGGPSRNVYVFDTTTNRVRLLGRFAGPVAHASALTLGGKVYVLGSAGVSRIDVASGVIDSVTGQVPVSDAGAVVLGNRGLLIGGDRGGRPVADVREALAP